MNDDGDGVVERRAWKAGVEGEGGRNCAGSAWAGDGGMVSLRTAISGRGGDGAPCRPADTCVELAEVDSASGIPGCGVGTGGCWTTGCWTTGGGGGGVDGDGGDDCVLRCITPVRGTSAKRFSR